MRKGPEAGVSGRHPNLGGCSILSRPYAPRTGPHPGRQLLQQVCTLQPASQAPTRLWEGRPGAPGISESTVWDGARESVSEFSGLHGHRWSQTTLRTTDLNYLSTAWFVLKTVPRCTTLVSLKHPSLSLSLGPPISQPPSEKTTAVTLLAST